MGSIHLTSLSEGFDAVGNGVLEIKVPSNVQCFEGLKLDILKGTLPIHVDANGGQVQSYFTGLHTLGVSKIGRHGKGGAGESFGVGYVRIQVPSDIVGKVVWVDYVIEITRRTRID